MPILDIQSRFRELGRIRLGEQQKTGGTYDSGPRKGQAKTRPVKLYRPRLTSPWQHLIEQAAEVFGGEARPWDNDGKAEFEVIVEAKSIPVVIPPGSPWEQWHELWKGGGLERRCDGQRMTLVDAACRCPEDPLERAELAKRGNACKPTTRVRLMIPDIADLGIWRLETHGFHAAAELSGLLGLVEGATQRGAMIPADLSIEPREGSRRPGEVRTKFIVPVLRLRETLGPALDALGILADGQTMPAILGVEPRPSLEAGGRAELPAGGTAFDPRPVETATMPATPVPDPQPRPPVEDRPPAPPEPEAYTPPDEAAPAPDHVPTPEPMEPPPYEAPVDQAPTGERAYSGAQIIAMRAQERGASSREEKLLLVRWIVGRAVESAKDLEPAEIRTVLEVLDRDDIDWPGTISALVRQAEPEPEPDVVAEPDPPEATTAAPPASGPTTARPTRPSSSTAIEASSRPADPTQWTEDDWRAFLSERGVRIGVLITEAGRLAAGAGVTAPANLSEVRGSGLEKLLVGYVEESSAQRNGASS